MTTRPPASLGKRLLPARGRDDRRGRPRRPARPSVEPVQPSTSAAAAVAQPGQSAGTHTGAASDRVVDVARRRSATAACRAGDAHGAATATGCDARTFYREARGHGTTCQGKTIDGPTIDTRWGPVQVEAVVSQQRPDLRCRRHPIPELAPPVPADQQPGAPDPSQASDASAERQHQWSQRRNHHVSWATPGPCSRSSTRSADDARRCSPRSCAPMSVMGTMASVHVHDQADVEVIDGAVTAMWSELDRLEQMFSTFRPSSEISRINAASCTCSMPVAEVHRSGRCVHLARARQRRRVPSPSTGRQRHRSGRIREGLGGRAGCEVPRTSRSAELVPLRRRRHPDARHRRATGRRGALPSPIRTATIRVAIWALVEVVGDAVATSGTAARGRHLWDGRTGQPAAALGVDDRRRPTPHLGRRVRHDGVRHGTRRRRLGRQLRRLPRPGHHDRWRADLPRPAVGHRQSSRRERVDRPTWSTPAPTGALPRGAPSAPHRPRTLPASVPRRGTTGRPRSTRRTRARASASTSRCRRLARTPGTPPWRPRTPRAGPDRRRGSRNTPCGSSPSGDRASRAAALHRARSIDAFHNRSTYRDPMLDPVIRDLAQGKNFGSISFHLPNGDIATHVMWVDADDEHVLINTEVHRAKYKSIVANPMSPWRSGAPRTRTSTPRFAAPFSGEIRGPAARAHIDALSQKYTGAGLPGRDRQRASDPADHTRRQRTTGL